MHRGERIGTRWEIGDVAGSGGMGVVYRATDLANGVQVAVKVVLGEGGDTLLRFRRETEILDGLLHPNLARRLDAGELPDGRAYLVLEWIEGMSLAQRLAEGALTTLEALQLVGVLASALSVVHADGVVHRDLKPTNVLLRGGNLGDPVLIDFGIARRGDDAMTRTGLVVGTPAYMAPEQAIGDRSIDARADIFSLGCILYECLTGRAPFAAPHMVAALTKVLFEAPAPIRPAHPEVPEVVEALVMRMLTKDRAARPRDAAAVQALVHRLVADVRLAAPAEEPLVATLPRSLLTSAEQRIVSVILLSAPGTPPPQEDATRIMDRSDGAPLERAPTSLPNADVLGRVRAVAGSFGAHVDGLLGGVVLVLTPASEVATDHAAGAARCALALRALLPEAPLSLAVGRAMLQEASLAGSVIDEAAALLLAARPDPAGAVRIGEMAAGLLDTSFDVRGDAVSLMLVGRRELGAPAAPRPVRGVSVPFVGRRRELDFIEGLLLESRQDRRAHAVLVTAAPGLGKSRLVAELLRRTAADSSSKWWCSAEPTIELRPFAIIGGLVAHAAQLRHDEPAEVRLRKLRARFRRELSGANAERTVEVLGELLPAAPAGDTVAASAHADSSLSDRARIAWLELVEAESRTRPLVLFVDDFQWADERSVRLLEAALHACENQPLTLVAAGRPEAEERFAAFVRDARVQVLKLGRLPDDDARSIVRAVGGAEPDADVGAILAQSQGNAFFLEELLRARWHRDAPVPDTMLAAVDARIDALSPLSRRLVRAASVFGDRFWEPAIQEMAGARAGATAEAVRELIDEELVVEDLDSEHPGARQLSFPHALVREAAYARLTDDDRRRGHRLAGMWLQRRAASAAAVVARHLEIGGEPQRAALWHALAAEQALERGDGQGALWHTEHAAGAPDDLAGRLLALEGIARYDLGDGERGLGCLVGALQRLPPRSAEWCHTFGLTLPLLLDRRRTDEAVVLCRTLLDSPDSARTPPVRAAAARAVLSLGIHEGRNELGTALLAIADGPGSPSEIDAVLEAVRQGYLALGRSQVASRRGDLGEAIAASEVAVAAFQRARNPRREANALNRLGDALKNVGAWGEALAVLDQGLSLVRRLGIAPTEATIASNRSWVLTMLGRLDEAVVEAARALDICTRVRIAFGVVYCRAYLARALLASRALADAERHARAAVEAAAGAPNARPFAQTMLAEVLLRAGNPSDALAQIAPVLVEAHGPKGMDEGDALAHLVHAEALHALGRQAEAATAIHDARGRIEARAALISDPDRRATFLAVPEHRRTIDGALGRAW